MLNIQNILATTLCTFVLCVPSVAQENQNVPPQMPDLNQNSDLAGDLTEWATDLQVFFNEQGADYSVASGIGNLDTQDKSSSRYMTSVIAAYKQALISAYVNLSIKLNPDGINLTTSDDTNANMAAGDLFRDNAIEECRNEARQAHTQHLKALEKKREDKDSLLGVLKAKLKGDTKNEITKPNINSEKPKDFIHSCFVDGPSFTQFSEQRRTVEDLLSGGRIWATVIHKDKLGLILVRSSDTAEIASVLKNQLKPASVNTAALREVRDRIKQELSQFAGIPQGVVGTRMMRLSNREWAIYAYGAYQKVGQANSGFMDSVMDSQVMLSASSEAMSELSRFSGLTINFDDIKNEVRRTKQKWRIDCNVTKDKCQRKMDEESTMGAIFNTVFSTSSDLQLVGSEQVFNRKFTDGPLNYYLAVQAWSPSIMAINISNRNIQDRAADNISRSDRYRTDNPNPVNPGAGKSKVIIFNQDW